ncbi:hypothetical protein [Endozoicomonas sp.]|uniref:hypothetical protein n=1 Tax=Endozoicomonas sp. TaxID=1892382 RepID=UPI00383A67B7
MPSPSIKSGLRIPLCGDSYGHAALHVVGRNLLYTGVTRGKQMVLLVSQPKAVGMAARTRKSNRRLTNLQARLGQV